MVRKKKTPYVPGQKVTYQLGRDGIFIGYSMADESPLEPGVWHIPAGCVEKEPPEFGPPNRARWDFEKEDWIIEVNPDLVKTEEENEG